MVKHQPSEARRAQLFEAALQVCAEKGYFNTRVEDIAQRAGLSKGAIYHHFPSKQELFLALFGEMMEGFVALMSEVFERSPSASAAMRTAMHQFVESFEQQPGLMRGMFDLYLLAVREPAFRTRIMGYYEKMVETAAALIQRGIDDGEFSAELDARDVAWVFFTSGDGLFLIHLSLDQEAKVVPMFEQLLEIFLRGLRAAPPPTTNTNEQE
jgi:TetR/AcrR family transcriptional regulator, fatty acid metabolism regulator protein